MLTDGLLVGVVIAAAVVALGYGAWWLWWRLPQRQVDRMKPTIRDAKARADVEDNFRKSAGQILVGIAAALIASLFTFVQYTQQQSRLDRDKSESFKTEMSNLFEKSLERLGSTTPPTRLGGMFALERVINSSSEYSGVAFETISTYVRDNTRSAGDDKPPSAEVQAALSVIGRRRLEFKTAVASGPDLSGVHIPMADLRGAELIRSALVGADLRNANLIGANLTEANLTGANLKGAKLTGAHLNRANLNNAALDDAILEAADLSGANLIGADLASAALSNAILDAADLSGAKGLTQEQLASACGTNVTFDPQRQLKIKPCPKPSGQ